jgi:hypothetical protein
MPAQQAAPPTVGAALGARSNVSIADRTSSIAKPSSQSSQGVSIRAELIGSDCCSGVGLVARGSAPVLALCRKLIEAGDNSTTALEVWCCNTLTLTIRPIDEGARLEVSPRGVGFVRRPDVRGSSYVAQNHLQASSPSPETADVAVLVHRPRHARTRLFALTQNCLGRRKASLVS